MEPWLPCCVRARLLVLLGGTSTQYYPYSPTASTGLSHLLHYYLFQLLPHFLFFLNLIFFQSTYLYPLHCIALGLHHRHSPSSPLGHQLPRPHVTSLYLYNRVLSCLLSPDVGYLVEPKCRVNKPRVLQWVFLGIVLALEYGSVRLCMYDWVCVGYV